MECHIQDVPKAYTQKKLRSSNFATKVPLFVSSWEVNQEKSNLDLTHLIDFPDCWTSILSDHSINEITHCFISQPFLGVVDKIWSTFNGAHHLV